MTHDEAIEWTRGIVEAGEYHADSLEKVLAAMQQAKAEIAYQAKEIESYKLTIKHEYGKREALDNQVATLTARLEAAEKVVKALEPLAAIADAYDNNELDDEARKFWGLMDEHQSTAKPEDIEIYSGRGGRQLLTLAHCMAARAALSAHRDAKGGEANEAINI